MMATGLVPIITEHAVIRWLEHTADSRLAQCRSLAAAAGLAFKNDADFLRWAERCGLDVEGARRDLSSLVLRGVRFGAQAVLLRDHVFVLQYGALVTVLHKSMRPMGATLRRDGFRRPGRRRCRPLRMEELEA